MSIDSRQKRESAQSFPGLVSLPVPDAGVLSEPDRAQVGWFYSGIDFHPIVSRTRRSFWIRMKDNYGNLSKALEHDAIVDWEYNRVGGCGQCNVTLITPYDFIERKVVPKASIEIYIDEELRYSGKFIKRIKKMRGGLETLVLQFYGYVVDLVGFIVQDTYENTEVSVIIKDLLDTYIVPNTGITYDEADVEVSDYVVQSITFNHSIRDAITLLAQLGGNFEWGVDRNKKFYFKRTDPNVRRVYVIGREVENFEELRDDEKIVNVLRVFGNNAAAPLAEVRSTLSVNIFGEKQDNLFESSISETSDANRLGAVKLKNLSNYQRAVRFSAAKDDEFIEETTPLGATTLQLTTFRAMPKYRLAGKYGVTNKYGNLLRDQAGNIRYRVDGGGMIVDVTLSNDVPNLGDTQKRVEYEIRELQRR
jgi:hypothetical protein